MKQQLKMLRKTIELAEKDITANYTEEEIRYMKKKYRELREEIRYAQRLQNNEELKELIAMQNQRLERLEKVALSESKSKDLATIKLP